MRTVRAIQALMWTACLLASVAVVAAFFAWGAVAAGVVAVNWLLGGLVVMFKIALLPEEVHEQLMAPTERTQP